jgi:glycosyltransferase involved in cell wall biosynthesis
MMRIAMVNTYHFLRGGDSRYALATADALRRRGHDVLPFAMRHPDSFETGLESFFPPEVDYPALMARRTPRALWSVLTSSIYNREARRGFANMLDAHPVDVVHLHSVMHHLTASVVLECYRRKLPVVWTLHDYKSICPTTRLLRDDAICEACRNGRFYNALRYRCKRKSLSASAVVTAELYLHRVWSVYERAALLVAPSPFLRDKVLEDGLRPRRIEVLPNFVDTSTVEPSQGDEGYVLFVGRLSGEKGLETLLAATARAGRELRVAGSGELEARLQHRCAAEGWTHVHFEGHCSGERLRKLYAGARMVAVPSEWYENCPLVVLEAFANAKPVVASRLGGLVDMVDPGQVGLLVEPGNVEAWAAAIADLGHDAGRCRDMGLRARGVAEERYAPDRHLDALEALYASVVERRD